MAFDTRKAGLAFEANSEGDDRKQLLSNKFRVKSRNLSGDDIDSAAQRVCSNFQT